MTKDDKCFRFEVTAVSVKVSLLE